MRARYARGTRRTPEPHNVHLFASEVRAAALKFLCRASLRVAGSRVMPRSGCKLLSSDELGNINEWYLTPPPPVSTSVCHPLITCAGIFHPRTLLSRCAAFAL